MGITERRDTSRRISTDTIEGDGGKDWQRGRVDPPHPNGLVNVTVPPAI
jgi:hypothetical protein